MNYINDFCIYLRVQKKYSKYTISSYYKDILQLYYFLQNKRINFLDVNYNIVKEYLSYLYGLDINRSSISRKLSSLRSFYSFLINENIMINNPFKEVSNPRKEKSLPVVLNNNQIEEMSKIPNTDTSIGQRNLLIIEMLYATGVRVGELVNIKISDIDFENRMIKILGKGSKERIVIYNLTTSDILSKYITNGRNDLLKSNNNCLFLNNKGNQLSERMVWNIVNDIITKTNIEIHISPHKLRHSFATEMLNNGADLVSVKELLGHESLNTTSIYTHLSNEQIRKVYENAHPRARR